jgi:hypothetical protein
MTDHIINNKQISNSNAYYTIVGNHDYMDENNNPRCETEDSVNVLAKRIYRDNGTSRYSIKVDNNGKIYNPLSIYDDVKQTSFLDRVCRAQNKYRDVNYKAFEMYLQFLKTKNLAWLHNAEREI